MQIFQGAFLIFVNLLPYFRQFFHIAAHLDK